MTQSWYFESYERLCEAVVKQADTITKERYAD